MKQRFNEDQPVIVIGDCSRVNDEKLDMKFNFDGKQSV